MAKNILKDKSYAFAIKVVKVCQYLNNSKKEYVISKQLLRSGTSVGALIREAEFGQSKKDFISKMSISLKEANETDYWITILKDTDYISTDEYKILKNDIEEILRMLVSSIKTAKKNL